MEAVCDAIALTVCLTVRPRRPLVCLSARPPVAARAPPLAAAGRHTAARGLSGWRRVLVLSCGPPRRGGAWLRRCASAAHRVTVSDRCRREFFRESWSAW